MFECQGCGASLPGRRSRKYCSNACQRASERKRHVALWLETGQGFAGTAPGHYMRSYIFDDQGGRCAVCDLEAAWNGHALTFVLDHVDGDASNNMRENLRLVCPNCDSQLTTYKFRNRGRGRSWRRDRYANGLSY